MSGPDVGVRRLCVGARSAPVGTRRGLVGLPDVWLSGLVTDLEDVDFANYGVRTLGKDYVGTDTKYELDDLYRWRFRSSAKKAVSCACPRAKDEYPKSGYSYWSLDVCSKRCLVENTSKQPELFFLLNIIFIRDNNFIYIKDYVKTNGLINTTQKTLVHLIVKNPRHLAFIIKLQYIPPPIISHCYLHDCVLYTFRKMLGTRQWNIGTRQVVNRSWEIWIRSRQNDIGARQTRVGIRPEVSESRNKMTAIRQWVYGTRHISVGTRQNRVGSRKLVIGTRYTRRLYIRLAQKILFSSWRTALGETSKVNMLVNSYMLTRKLRKLSYLVAYFLHLKITSMEVRSLSPNIKNYSMLFYMQNRSHVNYIIFLFNTLQNHIK